MNDTAYIAGNSVPGFIKTINMEDKEFTELSELIYKECGISLPPKKKVMLTSRLRKRLNVLGINSYEDYCQYLSKSSGNNNEIGLMIDEVTTNKTAFFREPSHFDFLSGNLLPELARTGKLNQNSSLLIWSAGCSTGEEPYSLAMVLAEYFAGQSFNNYEILGSDISMKVLKKAREAVYSDTNIETILPELRKKYLLRGKNNMKGLYRIVPELRQRVQFRHINLMNNNYELPKSVDIIFCRNVIIYFDKQTQKKLFEKFYNCLTPGGFLFIGHAETLHGINEQFEMVVPTVYRKPVSSIKMQGAKGNAR